MSFHSDRSEEKPFLLGVTMEIPACRNCGYALASAGSEVLSTSTERPGTEVRCEMISDGLNGPDLVRPAVEEAVCQSAGGMAGENDGAGDKRVCDERASRTMDGALGRRDNCFKNAVPTPPTPGTVRSCWSGNYYNGREDQPMTPR